MLLEYAISNYRSFADEAYFDLHPTRSKAIRRYPDSFVEFKTGERALKDAVIVGENASGKSNFVASIAFLRDLVVRADVRPRSSLSQINARNLVLYNDPPRVEDLKGTDSEQSFYVKIAFEDATYSYHLALDAVGIVSEELFYAPFRSSLEKAIFKLHRFDHRSCKACENDAECKDYREGGGCNRYQLEYGSDRGELSPEEVNRLDAARQGNQRRLSLVWLAAVGDEHCDRVLNWLANDVVVVRAPSPLMIESTVPAEELLSVLGTDDYLDIAKLVDRSIVAFELDRDHPLRESVLVREDGDGRRFRRSLKDDSAGVRQFFCWAYYIYQVVCRNKTVVADEVDSMINPVLSERVIAYINGSDHSGQYLFTTHNIFNLTLRTYMKEQIYFITKDPLTLTSTLYSAADFDEIRYDVKTELYEFYLKGMLGGTLHE